MMLWLQLSIMQIWLPFELDLIEKRFLVSESNISSIDELNKKHM